MDTSVRTLPLRTEPLDGEALDSWLEAISHRLSTAWGDLAEAVALPVAAGSTAWLCRLTPEQAAAITTATGQPTARLHAMTLSHYDGTGLRIRTDTGAADRTFPWARARFTRFCPDCLQENGGRWQLSWRLGWAFLCPRHRCLLIDECPCCGQRQGERRCPADLTPEPGHCALPAPGATGRAPQRCGAELSATSTVRFPQGHPVISAQRTIFDVIDSGKAAFGIYRQYPQTAEAMLSDVRAVGGRILCYATDDDLGRILAPDLVEAYRELKSRGVERGAAPVPEDKPGLAAPAHAVTAAVGVTAAIAVLNSADSAAAGERLHWLVNSGRANGLIVNTSNIGWGRSTTAILTAAQIDALAPLLKPSEQLRYRVGTLLPSKPSHAAVDVAALVTKLPAAMWPSWALRMCLPRQDYPHLSTALPCATLLVNTRLSFRDATAVMGRRDVEGPSLSYTLQQFHEDSRWNHLRDALVRLADHLYGHDCPIDYQRRRELDYSTLLTPATWKRICREVDVRSGGDRRARLARCYLYGTVSGSPARWAPWFTDVYDFASMLANFPAVLTPPLTSALNAEAQRFLAGMGIDEPVTWSPPEDLLAGLILPGSDPNDIDTAQLHRLVRKPLPLGDIAGQLSTPLECVRYALSLRPAADPEHGPSSRPAPALSDLAQVLPAAELAGLYQEQRCSLKQIAARYGVGRQLVARLARQYGIALRPPQSPRRHDEIDRDWLYTEYVMHRRTLPDLAAEKGMSTANMSLWAKTHGTPLRKRGGPSHTANINAAQAAQNAPALLRPALTSIGGAERLSRFAAATSYSTVTAAAAALGLNQPVLQGQIARLEAELGGPLFTRAQRGHPMALTHLGTWVLHAWTGRNPGGVGNDTVEHRTV